MAMIACKECKKEISNKAETCPHCGYKPYIPNFGFFDFLIISIIAVAITSWTFDEKPKPKLPDPPYLPKDHAAGACMLFIKQHLNDPVSAKFEPRKSAYIEDTGNNTFKVIYPLRAKNGFGGLVKTAYFCHMRYTDGMWHPIEVSQIN